MKILSLHFKNINSLKGEYTIDFSKPPFSEAGIFAIIGPTGSGKSTLLDVISLALYNRIPRLESTRTINKDNILKKGLILTYHTQEAFAEVTYACKKGTFRSRWFIQYNKNQNLNEYDMELSNCDTDTYLGTKSEVLTQNEQNIGLNYDQFIRSIVLAQGDFSKFLMEKKEERNKLLEAMTGQWIYKSIGMKSYQIHKERKTEKENLVHKKEALLEKILPSTEIKETESALKNNEALSLSMEKELLGFKQALALKEELKQLHLSIQGLEEKKTKAIHQTEKFNQNEGIALGRHKKLIPHKEYIQAWQNEKKAIQETESKSTEALKGLKNNEALLSELKKQIQFDLPTLSFSDGQLEQTLQQYEEQLYQVYEKDYLQASQAFHHLYEKIHDLSMQLNESVEKNNILKLKPILQEKIKHWELSQSHLDANAQTLTDRYPFYLQLLHDIKSKEEKIKEIEEKQEKNKGIVQEKQVALVQLEIQLKKLDNEIAQIQEEFYEKERLFLKENENLILHQLSIHLSEGQPCPLCGSKHHPDKVTGSKENKETENLIKTLKEALEQAQDQKKTIRTTIDIYQQQLTDLHKELGETESRKVMEQIQELKRQLPSSLQSKVGSEALSFLENIRQYVYYQKIIKQIDELELATEKGTKAKNILEKLFNFPIKKEKYNSFYQELRKKLKQFNNEWIRLRTEQGQLDLQCKNLEKEMLRQQEKLKQTEQQLVPHLQKMHYQRVEEAVEHLLSDVQYEAYNTLREKIQQDLTEIEAQLHSQRKITNEKSLRDLPLSLGILEEKLKDMEQNKAKLTQSILDQKMLLKSQKENKQQLQEVEQQLKDHQKENRKWQLLAEKIGDAEGKKFSTFALEITLKQLIVLANRRLQHLHKRYQLDLPQAKEEDLMVFDLHMGKQRRSVKTLSGGECFITSLALALALSDLASRDIEIDSLFIDEGFGSLDPETLDQTLDTLERLQAESQKTIGIISHIESLKERFHTQIVLKKTGNGFSSFDITCI